MLSTIPSRRELLAWVLALTLAFATITAINANRAEAGFAEETTDVVYLATGLNYPDALAAAAAASLGLGPVLLVEQDSIPVSTLGELNRLDPTTIYIVGGTAVISDSVKATLEGLSFSPTVVRIAGANRFSTAVALSEAVFPTTGLYPRASFDSSDATVALTGANPWNLGDVTIDAPRPGIILINAGARYEIALGAPAEPSCWLELDDSIIEGTWRRTWLVDSYSHDTCATQGALTVDTGSYSIEFMSAAATGQTTVESSTVWAMWVPFDGHGAYIIP